MESFPDPTFHDEAQDERNDDVWKLYDPEEPVDPLRRATLESWLSRGSEQEQKDHRAFLDSIDRRNREALEWEMDQELLYTRVLTPPPSPPQVQGKSTQTNQNKKTQPSSNRIRKPAKPLSKALRSCEAPRKAHPETVRRPATRFMRPELVALDPDKRNRVRVVGLWSDVGMSFAEYRNAQAPRPRFKGTLCRESLQPLPAPRPP